MASPLPAAPLRGCPWLPGPCLGASPWPPNHFSSCPAGSRRARGASGRCPGGNRAGAGGLDRGTRQEPSQSHLPPDCIGARQSPGGLAPGMELAYSGYRDMAERNLAPRHPFSSPPLRPPLPPPAPHHHHHPPLQIPQPSRRSQCKGTPGGARKGGEAWEGGPGSDHGAPVWTTRPRLGARRHRGGKESGAGSAPVTPGVRFCSLSRQDKSGVTPPRAVAHNELPPPLLGGSPGSHGLEARGHPVVGKATSCPRHINKRGLRCLHLRRPRGHQTQSLASA